MRRALRIGLGVAVVLAVLVALILGPLRLSAERWAVLVLTEDYTAADSALSPTFDGPDADLPRAAIRLQEVATGVRQPTDVQFLPDGTMLVAEKGGRLLRIVDGQATTVAAIPVLTDSEQGLLGVAVDPAGDRLWVYAVEAAPNGDVGRVRPIALRPDGTGVVGAPILQVFQPYQNHNGGQLAFGPDGALYLGLGDGGLRDDPLGVGRDPRDWLGAILRVRPTADGYAIPPDNPYADGVDGAPEVWATGLRNPWRFAWTPDGRMVVADVGQDRWEELSWVTAGADLGWSDHEGDACFPPDAPCADDAVAPFHTYGRDAGRSITGGHVARGPSAPAIRDRYVFGDFVSGRLWAIDLTTTSVTALGRWPILPSTFGKDGAGDVYVADFARGVIYRITTD